MPEDQRHTLLFAMPELGGNCGTVELILGVLHNEDEL